MLSVASMTFTPLAASNQISSAFIMLMARRHRRR
jgi:hypothetical protein